MEKMLTEAYIFEESDNESYLVPATMVKREYYVDEGFYLVEGKRVIFACPECGDLVGEDEIGKITAFIPESAGNLQILERHSIDLEEDMLLEALECYEANAASLELEPFEAAVYENDPDARQYVADFGYRQLASDTAKKVRVAPLEKNGSCLIFQLEDRFLATAGGRILGEFEELEAARKIKS